jgi:hypothetical protein
MSTIINYSYNQKKQKYYQIMVIKILLLSLIALIITVVFATNIDFFNKNNCFLQFINNKINENSIIVTYKDNLMSGKIMTAYYFYVHPIIAILIIIFEIFTCNHSLNDEEYNEFYRYSVEIYGKERNRLKVAVTVTPLLYFLLYSGFFNKAFSFQKTFGGILTFNIIFNTLLLLALIVLVRGTHSLLTNYLR